MGHGNSPQVDKKPIKFDVLSNGSIEFKTVKGGVYVVE